MGTLLPRYARAIIEAAALFSSSFRRRNSTSKSDMSDLDRENGESYHSFSCSDEDLHHEDFWEGASSFCVVLLWRSV